jgi:ClpP class serine protease
MSGMVGEKMRAEEIDAIAAQADELGPGQTIVLHITSGGGYVVEWWMIRDAIYEAQKRHRVVAWVRDATSAAASTSLACDVIVFESQGHLGSITTLGGGGTAQPVAAQIQGADNDLAPVLVKSGRSPLMAVPFMRATISSMNTARY